MAALRSGYPGSPSFSSVARAASRVEFSRPFVDLQVVADAGVDGLLYRKIATERVDRRDPKLRRKFEQTPVELFGSAASARAARASIEPSSERSFGCRVDRCSAAQPFRVRREFDGAFRPLRPW